ncbi:MAG: arginyltransferase [Bdellovibrionota bacterium]
MRSVTHFIPPPSRCEYLKDRKWQLEYEEFASISRLEYHERMLVGWRRFGHMLFRPHCPTCNACKPLRVKVDEFEPNRSQRRAERSNERVELQIGEPDLIEAVFSLYHRYHEHQHHAKSWTAHNDNDPFTFYLTFVAQPFETEAWYFVEDGRLLGVGYVDVLPDGLSAIYFFYEPTEMKRSLGTFNILSLIRRAKQLELPFVYLGYFVEGSKSMAYKALFKPFELLDGGVWRPCEPERPAAATEPPLT